MHDAPPELVNAIVAVVAAILGWLTRKKLAK